MNRHSGKKQSLRSIIMRPMVIVHVIIVVIFISTINTFDVLGRLRTGEVENLRRAVTLRGRQIEERLLILGATATSMAQRLEDAMELQMGAIGEDLEPAQAEQLLALSVPIFTDGLRRKEASGAFVVLNTSVSQPENGGIFGSQASALYLMDEAVTTMASEDHPILLTGPKHLARDPILPLDNYWSTELLMGMFDDTSFLRKPFEAAVERPELGTQRLCYWAKPVCMNGNREALMVTVPLRSGERVLGVVGVELSLDRLRAMLSASELYEGDASFYGLAEGALESTPNAMFVKIGSFATRHIEAGEGDHRARQMHAYGDDVLEMDFADREKATAVRYPFNLYYQDSPFREESWALVGGVENGDLFGATGMLLTILVVSFSAAILIALAFAFLMTGVIERPLRRLSKQLSAVDVDIQDIQLEKTDIREVDMLIESIETLSGALAESGERTIKAIEMTGMPIGLIERNPEKRQVFMTDLAFSLLELKKDPGVNTISLGEWDEIHARLLRHPEGSEEGVYHLQSPETTQQRYLRLRMAEDQNRTFGILMDVTAQVLARRELELERDTDPLTGLLNRGAFLTAARQEIERDPGKIGIMLFADLDNLKYVNDTYGHDMGDRYIQSAGRMFEVLREHGGIVARISGDEFAIFIYGYEEAEPLQKLLLTMPETLEQANNTSIILPDNSRFKLRYSMGYAWYPEDSTEMETLLRYADYAMYEIKRSSKGSMRGFSMESYVKNSFLIEKNEAFLQILEKNLVHYAFQPLVDVYTGSVFGYEALMRPDSKELHTPERLLRMAESQGKLYLIERMTFFNVFAWMKANAQALQGLRVFINSISGQVLSPKDAAQLETSYGELFRRVVIEVTENLQGEETQEKLGLFRRLGAGVALDDAGGDSANELKLLKTQPEYLKVDRSLVQQIDMHEDKQEMVESMVSYAQQNGIQVIAEGVETREELEWVIRLGVDYVQGFYIGMPDYDLRDIPVALKQELQEMAIRLRDRRKG